MSTQTGTQGESPRVTLEGTYSAADYLEETLKLERTGYTATIGEGRIEVAFHEPEPLPDADRQAAVSREVSQVFNARMILSGRSAAVSDLALQRRHPDGRKDVWVSAASIICLTSAFSHDIIVKDAEGNIIRDTKAERLADERGFREQCLRHAADPLFQALMASFSRAVADPGDRMTHLYEIRDALSRHFGGEKETRKALRLTDAEWSDLGRIANHEPIQESRHRGKYPALRPATEEEQTRALGVARRMFRAYLDLLDRSPTA